MQQQQQQSVQVQYPFEESFNAQKNVSFFSKTEVKPAQDNIQMLPTMPKRSNSLSKPIFITPTYQKPQEPYIQQNFYQERSISSMNVEPFKKQVTTAPVAHHQRPSEQPQKNYPLRFGSIESTRVENLPYPSEPPKNTVEIVRAYQKYSSGDSQPQDQSYPKYPSGSQQPKTPMDPTAVTMPKILDPLRDANLVEGGHAVFECRVQGQPLSIQWFKGETPLKNQFRHKIFFDEPSGIARLVISTVLEDDADVYTCRITNSVGEAVTSARLTHFGKTFFTYSKLKFQFSLPNNPKLFSTVSSYPAILSIVKQ
jgi:hypothetical protein